MSFRPAFWPTLFTIPALILLIGLGTWQVQRLHWKEDLIQKLQQRATAEAVAPPTAADNLEDFEFRQVSMRGRYLHDKELYLINRSMRGNPGVHVFTPLEVENGGPAILVNRGWVPSDKRDPAARHEGLSTETQTVTGLVRLEKGKGLFLLPDNDAANNVWLYVDINAMAQKTGIDLARGFYVVAADDNVPGGFPIGRQWTLDVRNDHREYAITWFSLAIALAVIYVVYHRRRS